MPLTIPRLRVKFLNGLRRFAPPVFDVWTDFTFTRGRAAACAPWRWSMGARGPERRVEAGAAQVGARLFIAGGLIAMEKVCPYLDVFDLARARWTERRPLPPGMPHTHHGVATDGQRFIYYIAGQLGPNCSPCVAECFVLDTVTLAWSEFPPLPEVRYAPTAFYRDGRLHAVGGARADRHASATDHWSIAVVGGRPTEAAWRSEPAVPMGGPHRPGTVFDGALYLFGGQEGDIKPRVGDPEFICDFQGEDVQMHAEVYRLPRGATIWEKMASLPEPCSHMEFAGTHVPGSILFFGGTPQSKVLTDSVHRYDFAADRWSIYGRLPYGLKNGIVGQHQGRIFVVNGQRITAPDDLTPGHVLNSVWSAPLPQELRRAEASP